MNIIFDMQLDILKENCTTTFKIHLIEAQYHCGLISTNTD